MLPGTIVRITFDREELPAARGGGVYKRVATGKSAVPNRLDS